MVKNILAFYKRNFFANNFSLEHRIYMIFFLESYIISIVSAIANTALGMGFWGIALQWLYVIVCTVLLLASPQLRHRLQKPQLLFLTLIYLPFLYFQTGGYDGSVIVFFPLAIFVLAISFSGNMRIITITLNIICYIGCIAINYYYPHLITPIQSAEERIFDLIVSLVLSLWGMALLAIHVSSAFVNKTNELEDITNRDVLTGVFNRRYLFEYLRRKLNSNRESDLPLCALMLDIDFFKNVNDTYGHALGDDVLCQFTKTVQNVLRDDDILARYGGEEFVVLLSGVNIDKAAEIAERTRLAVSKINFPNNIHITVSIGLSMANSDDTEETFINRADAGLYQAKQQGRNQVCNNL